MVLLPDGRALDGFVYCNHHMVGDTLADRVADMAWRAIRSDGMVGTIPPSLVEFRVEFRSDP